MVVSGFCLCYHKCVLDILMLSMPFTPISDSIGRGRQSTLKKQVDADRVVSAACSVFAEMFGEDYEQHVKPLYLKNRTLTVSCNTSAAAQEVRLNQAKIVDDINVTMGSKEVDRIRYLL